ncbi:hypothetical protein DVH24_019333 [Malus domestica]|uniref:Uncharacterized protein n=1 Tax=Malus domestica TaxID=3750 RepID=A0A498I328_MALDO|nr:hypothetical protein DVH24_019333 [Malus domestica]
MATPTESLLSIARSVSTNSTKKRVRIFHDEIPAVLSNSEIGTESVLPLIDIIFQTLYITMIVGQGKLLMTSLQKVYKSFAAALVQVMEKQTKLQSHVGCDRLPQWSCLLLSKSKFATVSKNALWPSHEAFLELIGFGFHRNSEVKRVRARAIP